MMPGTMYSVATLGELTMIVFLGGALFGISSILTYYATGGNVLAAAAVFTGGMGIFLFLAQLSREIQGAKKS